jgi:small GTP-binding protein
MSSEPSSSDSPVGEGSFRADVLLPQTVDFESLRRYTSAKLSIANQLRSLLDLLKKRHDESRVHSCERLMAKLAEDRFTIAVLGQFKRGKSSLLNAIIGRSLLPTGILPLTTVITIVRFGSRERLVIQRKGLRFPEHEPIAALPDYVTSQCNPDNRKGIETVAIELPLPYLRRGLQFVDTPGVGSAIKANTETTYSFLPNCDAVLFVTSAEGPLSEAELELLTAIKRYAGKIFFVLNKIDLLADESEAIHVTEFVKSLLAQALNVAEINLFPVSAQKGLEASLSESAFQFAKSGLLDLEKALARFLASDREVVFLKAVVEGARSLLGLELSDSELADQANQVTRAERDRRIYEIKVELKRLEVERLELLNGIRDQLAKYVFGEVARELVRGMSAQSAALIKRVETFLSVGRFCAASSVAQRYARAIVRRIRKHLLRWAEQNQEHFAQSANALTVDAFRRLRQNLDDLAVLPRKAFGLEIAGTAGVGEELGALSLEPKSKVDVLVEWNPSIRRSLGFCPAFTVRRLLRTELESGLLKFVSQQQNEALNIIWKQLDEALCSISVRTTERAASLNDHAIAMLSVGTDQLEGEFRDENSPSYRDQLRALCENFSLIREEIQSSTKNQSGASFVVTRPIPVPKLRVTPTAPLKAGLPSDHTTRGCPVCDHLVWLSKEFFFKFQYALYNDEREQESFAQSGGFCPFHTWQLEAISSPVGFSVGCAKLVKRLSTLLSQAASFPERVDEKFRQLFPARRNCRVCSLLREAEQAQVRTLIASLQGTATRQLYARSQGVCFLHLQMLVDASPDGETSRFLLDTASSVFESIAEDMEGFALKREATRRHLVDEDEEDAYLRAIVHFAGAKDNCRPWAYREEF